MTKGCSSMDRRKSAADKSVHLMLAFRLSALALFAAAAFSTQGEVLVYEGFHPEDYNNVAASGEVQVNTTFTAGHTIGVSTSKWGGPSGAMTKCTAKTMVFRFRLKWRPMALRPSVVQLA